MRKPQNGIIMRYPATRWQDALPTGSGSVGLLLYGQIRNDIIVLNHDALYYPKEKHPFADVSELLPELRRLIDSGRYKEAERLIPEAYRSRTGVNSGSTSSLRDPYQPLGAIHLHTSTAGAFRGYRRGVDFRSGRVWIQWTDDAGTFKREAFVSRITDTIFLRIRGSVPGALHCRLSLGKQRDEQAGDKTLYGSAEKPSAMARQVVSENRFLTYVADYPNGISFGAVAMLDVTGGQVHTEDRELVIESADGLALQTRLFVGEDPNKAISRLVTAFTGGSNVYENAFIKHAKLHDELFSAMTFKLDQTKDQSSEEMLMAAYDGNVQTSLINTMFEFGRYLLICSSRPGSWPANLQGVWNGDYAPAWNSDFHTDENIQMNYWQALPGGLWAAALPFYEYFERHLDDYHQNAKRIFGCRGIFVPIAQTTHGREYPCIWTNWISAAGWIGQHFYDYYLFTGDLEFLRNRAVPWLKKVALFYEDFLVETGDGTLLFSPSLSPENTPVGNGTSLLTKNATMDIAVCREVLTNLCDACELLDIERDGVIRWRDLLAGLTRYSINEDGAMKEWLHPDFKDNYHHRHLSHLYPLFPGLEITKESHPELYEACRVAVEKRLVIGLASQTGWSLAHMAGIYSRLGMGNRALECLAILTRSSVGPNLFTYLADWRDMGLSHGGDGKPPFQIDANLGFTAAILEMLVFSKPGLVKLLPALPDKWSVGRATGVRCRGGISADLHWDVGRGVFHAELVSRSEQPLLVSVAPFAENIIFDPRASATPATDREPGYWNVALRSDEPLHIHSRL